MLHASPVRQISQQLPQPSYHQPAPGRAAGIPARYVGSVSLRGDDKSMDYVFHRWTEIYLPNYGWIPVDPSGGDRNMPGAQANYFGSLSNNYCITTQSGGGSKTMKWTYNSNEFWTCDPKTNVIEYFGDWEPYIKQLTLKKSIPRTEGRSN